MEKSDLIRAVQSEAGSIICSIFLMQSKHYHEVGWTGFSSVHWQIQQQVTEHNYPIPQSIVVISR